ncbi:hypothetical protein CSC3H3_21635 (plasmid) [Thalassospira marina]|uniref:Uncharacterized protein n=1 Tax=Thalassospira marina TaxID=2048283 RepID=A0ABM6QFU1_9PROT|nr:hypothetical protein CSC3H3_21635 [Thalassospira marina]
MLGYLYSKLVLLPQVRNLGQWHRGMISFAAKTGHFWMCRAFVWGDAISENKIAGMQGSPHRRAQAQGWLCCI